MHLLSLLAFLAQSTAKKITVCTPATVPGFQTTTILTAESEPQSLQFKDSSTRLGPWDGVGINEKWMKPMPLVGFIPDLLPRVMERAGLTDYELYGYNTFNEALYRTSITGECDVGFATFTITAMRSNVET
jgi:hypothetical protein